MHASDDETWSERVNEGKGEGRVVARMEKA